MINGTKIMYYFLKKSNPSIVNSVYNNLQAYKFKSKVNFIAVGVTINVYKVPSAARNRLLPT